MAAFLTCSSSLKAAVASAMRRSPLQCLPLLLYCHPYRFQQLPFLPSLTRSRPRPSDPTPSPSPLPPPTRPLPGHFKGESFQWGGSAPGGSRFGFLSLQNTFLADSVSSTYQLLSSRKPL